MYELIPLSPNDFYFDCPAKIGLVRISETGALLIDSGSDKDAGKKVLRAVEAAGYRLEMILLTHSHADHTGGCRFLQERTGCAVYAPGLESTFAAHPELEPMTLWGGAPLADLRHKFLLAPACDAAPLAEAPLPAGFEVIPLPGHSFEMVGYRTPDNTVFLADCLASRETLEKYGLSYLWDPDAFVRTLENVCTLTANIFVPAHAAPVQDIAPLARYNIEAVRGAEARIVALCAEPRTFEELLAALFDAYGMVMTVQQYALIGSTLRSYLTSLHTRGKLVWSIEGSRMLWRAAE